MNDNVKKIVIDALESKIESFQKMIEVLQTELDNYKKQENKEDPRKDVVDNKNISRFLKCCKGYTDYLISRNKWLDDDLFCVILSLINRGFINPIYYVSGTLGLLDGTVGLSKKDIMDYFIMNRLTYYRKKAKMVKVMDRSSMCHRDMDRCLKKLAKILKNTYSIPIRIVSK